MRQPGSQRACAAATATLLAPCPLRCTGLPPQLPRSSCSPTRGRSCATRSKTQTLAVSPRARCAVACQPRARACGAGRRACNSQNTACVVPATVGRMPAAERHPAPLPHLTQSSGSSRLFLKQRCAQGHLPPAHHPTAQRAGGAAAFAMRTPARMLRTRPTRLRCALRPRMQGGAAGRQPRGPTQGEAPLAGPVPLSLGGAGWLSWQWRCKQERPKQLPCRGVAEPSCPTSCVTDCAARRRPPAPSSRFRATRLPTTRARSKVGEPQRTAGTTGTRRANLRTRQRLQRRGSQPVQRHAGARACGARCDAPSPPPPDSRAGGMHFDTTLSARSQFVVTSNK